jgi:hypothetical protein
MNTIAYISGTDVIVTIPLISDGVLIPATEVDYRILNQDDAVLVARAAHPTFVVTNTEVAITIPAIHNTISPLETVRELRVIELFVNDGTGEIKLSYEYIIEKELVLIEGINSFQSYGRATIEALTLSKVDEWHASGRNERTNVLIEARRNIGAISLKCNTVESAGYTRYDNDVFAFNDITKLTQAEFLALPIELKEALRRAQILQANYLLKDDEATNNINDGIAAITVGDAKHVYQAKAKLKTLIDKRALLELSKWINSGVRIGRA